MRRANLEMTVGFFVLMGLACLAYLAINLGKIEIYGEGYQIYANFENASGLKTGSAVEVAGVEVGRVDIHPAHPLVSGPGQHKVASRTPDSRRCHRLHPHQGDHRG